VHCCFFLRDLRDIRLFVLLRDAAFADPLILEAEMAAVAVLVEMRF
jgi:hypothetical protein